MKRIRLGVVDIGTIALMIASIALLLTILYAISVNGRIDALTQNITKLSGNVHELASQLSELSKKVSDLIRYSPYFTG